MDLGIRGKVAMVAAGSKGLGRAAALALAAEGCAVSICGRGAEALASTKAELEALGSRRLWMSRRSRTWNAGMPRPWRPWAP